MPRLSTFHLKIETGEQGPRVIPRYSINGFKVDFDEMAGGTAPGEVLEVSAHPQSFPHSLMLLGPDEGPWDIKGIEAVYECEGVNPYRVRFGEVTLDPHADLNIWVERPAKVIDV